MMLEFPNWCVYIPGGTLSELLGSRRKSVLLLLIFYLIFLKCPFCQCFIMYTIYRVVYMYIIFKQITHKLGIHDPPKLLKNIEKSLF